MGAYSLTLARKFASSARDFLYSRAAGVSALSAYPGFDWELHEETLRSRRDQLRDGVLYSGS